MVSDEFKFLPKESIQHDSDEENPARYIPMYIYSETSEMLPGMFHYRTYHIGRFMWTVSLVERSTYTEVVGNWANQMPENDERRFTSDSFTQLIHHPSEYLVLMHPRDAIAISEILAGFDEHEMAENYYNSLLSDIEKGDIHLIRDKDGTLLFEWKGPPLLPVQSSQGPREIQNN